MSTRLQLTRSAEGIATVKEVWLDELTHSQKVEDKKEQEVKEYIRQLTELNERRKAEIAALQTQAHRLGKHAMRLQQARERAQEQAKEADHELEREFRELADRWYGETMFLSSTSDMLSKETYYQIVALGRKIIPFILRELQERGGHWFLALRVLAKTNPVRPEDRGNMRKMTQAWLDWGRKHNYI